MRCACGWLDCGDAACATAAVRSVPCNRSTMGLIYLFARYACPNSAGWSSLVARRAHNPEVVGSNPAPATKTHTLIREKRVGVFVWPPKPFSSGDRLACGRDCSLAALRDSCITVSLFRFSAYGLVGSLRPNAVRLREVAVKHDLPAPLNLQQRKTGIPGYAIP